MTTATLSDLRALESELRRAVSGEVRFDATSKALYSTDASLYSIPPVGVVLPRSAEDVQTVVTLCVQAGVAVLPRGGGTSLAGQTVNHAVVLDFTRHMRGVSRTTMLAFAYKLGMAAERRWKRIRGLDQLGKLIEGVHFQDGSAVETSVGTAA
ncbi:MAG: FAD-binding oxidoreductase [Chloroflexi bacterium]|nr:FAD-binding oxidoreductase [Chloroflexota bacterium]